jgi:hypothetical protein
MIKIKDLKDKADIYAKEFYGKDQTLFEPMFRKKDNNYFFGFLITELVNEEEKDYNIKRPTKWLLTDIITGDLVEINDSYTNDYTSKDLLPFDKVFKNEGSSKLYDYSNYILISYHEWKQNIIKELYNKNNVTDNTKVLRQENENISPEEFITANVETILDEAHHIIVDKLGNKVSELYLDYFEHLIDQIRIDYLENKKIDSELLIQYNDLLKYSWPDFIEVIDTFNNI